MFYSHESTFLAIVHSKVCQLMILRSQVLTSREGGVATVWYVLNCPLNLSVRFS